MLQDILQGPTVPHREPPPDKMPPPKVPPVIPPIIPPGVDDDPIPLPPIPDDMPGEDENEEEDDPPPVN